MNKSARLGLLGVFFFQLFFSPGGNTEITQASAVSNVTMESIHAVHNRLAQVWSRHQVRPDFPHMVLVFKLDASGWVQSFQLFAQSPASVPAGQELLSALKEAQPFASAGKLANHEFRLDFSGNGVAMYPFSVEALTSSSTEPVVLLAQQTSSILDKLPTLPAPARISDKPVEPKKHDRKPQVNPPPASLLESRPSAPRIASAAKSTASMPQKQTGATQIPINKAWVEVDLASYSDNMAEAMTNESLYRQVDSYLTQVAERIGQHWHLVNKAVPKCRVNVMLRINQAGQLRGANITKPCGNAELEQNIMAAIRKASPFPALPSNFPDQQIEINYRYVGTPTKKQPDASNGYPMDYPLVKPVNSTQVGGARG